jgi:hypothetical protein
MRLLSKNDEKFLTEAFDDEAREGAIEKRERWRTRSFLATLLLFASLALAAVGSDGPARPWTLLLLVATSWSTIQIESELRLLRVLDCLRRGAADKAG